MTALKRKRTIAICLLLAVVIGGALAACGGSSAGTGNTTAPTATSAATATPKPKPTSAPHVTLAYCQQIMSLSEMNALFQPPSPATSIVAKGDSDFSACNYEVSQTNVPLAITFIAYTGPVPIPQSQIDAFIQQLVADAYRSPDVTVVVTKNVPVSGIGLQAQYFEETLTGSSAKGSTHTFYVLEGPFIFTCSTIMAQGPGIVSPGFLGTQAQLQQCATQVDNRL